MNVEATPEESSGSLSALATLAGSFGVARPGLVACGVVLLLVCSLTGAVLTSGAATAAVLVAAAEVPAGRPITLDDLLVVEISGGAGAAAVGAERLEEIVGRQSSVPLAEGVFLHPSWLVEQEVAAEIEIVGATLRPGAYPQADLLPGDQVTVHLVNPSFDGEATSSSLDAVVSSVDPVGSADDLLIALEVFRSDAGRVAVAAAQDQVRIGLRTEPLLVDGGRAEPGGSVSAEFETAEALGAER